MDAQSQHTTLPHLLFLLTALALVVVDQAGAQGLTGATLSKSETAMFMAAGPTLPSLSQASAP
jgi:hypothetical protein